MEQEEIDIEESLVNLYVSIENKQFEKATTLVRKLINKFDKLQNAQLSEVLNRIAEHLDNDTEPSKDDLDTITVLMVDKCHS